MYLTPTGPALAEYGVGRWGRGDPLGVGWERRTDKKMFKSAVENKPVEGDRFPPGNEERVRIPHLIGGNGRH